MLSDNVRNEVGDTDGGLVGVEQVTLAGNKYSYYQFHIGKNSLPWLEITSSAGNLQHGHIQDWAERLPHHSIPTNQPTFILQVLFYVALTNVVIIRFVVAEKGDSHIMNSGSTIVVVVVIVVIKILIYVLQW